MQKKTVLMMAAATMIGAVVLNSGCASSRRMTRNSRFSEEANLKDKSSAAINYKNDLRGDVTGTQVNAWPLCYVSNQFVSVLWPVYDHDDRGMAIRPFYNRDDKEYSILFPLTAWNPVNGDGWVLSAWWLPENRYGVWPFFSRNAAPFALSYWGKNTFSCVPLLSYFYNSDDEQIFTTLPLYFLLWNKQHDCTMLLTPLAGAKWGEGASKQFQYVVPFYVYNYNQAKTKNWLLTPLGGGEWGDEVLAPWGNIINYYWGKGYYGIIPFCHFNSRHNALNYTLPGVFWWNNGSCGVALNNYWDSDYYGSIPFFHWAKNETGTNYIFPGIFWWNSGNNGWALNFSWDKSKKEYGFLPFYAQDSDSTWVFPCFYRTFSESIDPETHETVTQTKSVWAFNSYYRRDDFHGSVPFYHWSEEDKYLLPGIFWGGSATSSYQFFLPILSGWWNSGNFPYTNRHKYKDNGYYYLKSGWMAGLLAGYEYEICLSIKDEGNVSLGQDIIKDIPEAEFTKDNPQITEYFDWRENYAAGGWPFRYEWNSENNDFELYSFTPLNYIQRENNRYSIMGISSLLYHQENHSYNEFSLALLGLLYYRDADYTVKDNNRQLRESKWSSFIFLAGGEATKDEAQDHVLWYLYRHKQYGQNSVTSIFPFMSIRDNEDSTEFSWIWDGFMSLKHSETSGYSGSFLFLPF